MLKRTLLSTLNTQRRVARAAAVASTAAKPRFFSTERRHVIAALVVNQPGCLAEIANLFAARGMLSVHIAATDGANGPIGSKQTG